MGKLKQLLCRHSYETRFLKHVISGDEGAASLAELIHQIRHPKFDYWYEPYSYCPKCYKEIHSLECEHDWKPANDDGSGPLLKSGIKPKRVAICSKCGTPLYRVSADF